MSRVGAVVSKLGPVTIAVGVAAFLGLLFQAVAARWLTPAQFSTFLVAWGLLFGLASTVGVIEQEISRVSAHAYETSSAPTREPWRLTMLVWAISSFLLAVTWLVPSGRQLLADRWIILVLVWLALSGLIVQFSVRGMLLGQRKAMVYAAVLTVEPVLRLAVLTLVVWLLPGDLLWALIAVSAGSVGWLVAWGQFRRLPAGVGGASWGELARRLLPLLLAGGLLALLLTGFPVLVQAVTQGAPEQLAPLFGIVQLSRLPMLALAPVQTWAIAVTVGFLVQGKMDALAKIQLRLTVGTVVLGAAAFAVSWWLGPWAVTTYLGSKYAHVSPHLVAWVMASGVVMAAALLQVAPLVALQRYWSAVVVWAVAVMGAVIGLVVPLGHVEARGILAFALGSFTAFVGSVVSLWTAISRSKSPQAV